MGSALLRPSSLCSACSILWPGESTHYQARTIDVMLLNEDRFVRGYGYQDTGHKALRKLNRNSGARPCYSGLGYR